MEDINKETTNLLENDIVEKKESLAVENKKNTDLAESKSDNVKKFQILQITQEKKLLVKL